MKLSCTQISMSDELSKGTLDVRGFIDYCAELGFDGVDLLDPNHYTAFWRDAPTDPKAIHGWLSSAGVALAAFGCGNNFALNDADQRAEQIEKVKAGLRTAAELGAPVVRIFGGQVWKVDPAQGMRWVREGIEACLPVAEETGVVMGLENHGGLPGQSFELEALCRAIDSPCLRITFDCGNFIANNMVEVEDPNRALDALVPYIAHVHFKDFGPHRDPKGSGKRVEARVAGEGDVPLRQLSATLVKAGYAGYYTLEYEAGAVCPEREGVRKSFEFMDQTRRLLEALDVAQLADREPCPA